MKAYIIFLIITIALVSCRDDYLIKEELISEDELLYIPFEDGEIVSYINTNTNDVLRFRAESIICKVYKQYDGVNTDRYFEYEICRQKLFSENVLLSLSIDASNRIYSEKSIYGIYWYKNNNDLSSYCRDETFIPMDTSYFQSRLIQIDSLNVNNKLYYNVFKGKLQNISIDSLLEPFPINYFYCLPYGIIRFDLSDSTSLELEKIE